MKAFGAVWLHAFLTAPGWKTEQDSTRWQREIFAAAGNRMSVVQPVVQSLFLLSYPGFS
jgi:hypothetical protein